MDKPKPVNDQKRPKVVFSLDTPMPPVEWPVISPTDQNTILELLCSLLYPIVQHRALHGKPSAKKKGSKKRKRTGGNQPPPPPSPPKPELMEFLTIGLNSTTEYLEAFAGQHAAAGVQMFGDEPMSEPEGETALEPEKVAMPEPSPRRPMRAVFVCRADSQPSQLHSHFPVLCGLAEGKGKEVGGGHPVRLVQLPKGANARLAASLGIPRVGFLGIMEGAPGSPPLISFLDQTVPPVRIPWLDREFDYRRAKIKAMKTTTSIGARKKKQDKQPTAS